MEVTNDGNVAEKISDTPQYQSFELLGENTSEAVLPQRWHLKPDTHPFCMLHSKP